LPVVQKEMLRFKHFRTVEKPPRWVRLENFNLWSPYHSLI
jgi:hypothetical protein